MLFGFSGLKFNPVVRNALVGDALVVHTRHRDRYFAGEAATGAGFGRVPATDPRVRTAEQGGLFRESRIEYDAEIRRD